jgi:tetratricopeptide (TPR) repeat protein
MTCSRPRSATGHAQVHGDIVAAQTQALRDLVLRNRGAASMEIYVFIGRLLQQHQLLRSPAIRRIVAFGCSIAVASGIGRARWSARLGRTLRDAGRYDQAIKAYSRAINGGTATSWQQIVNRLADDRLPSDTPPAWAYALGITLRDTRERDAAATLVRAAVARSPDNARWLTTLATLEADTGNLAGAIDAQRRLDDLTAAADPCVRLTLATYYNQAGRWQQAAQILTDNVARHPEHAASHKLLADVATSMATWNGTFVDTVHQRSSGHFAVGLPTDWSNLTELARDALTRAVDIEPSRTSWRGALADALVASGDLARAVDEYDRAISAAEASNQRWALGVKQRWQFQAERCRHLLGHGLVDDPLFAAELRPATDTFAAGEQAPGVFNARLTYSGLAVSGYLATPDIDAVDVYLGGERIRRLNPADGGHLPQFVLVIKRRTLALFPGEAQLEVRCGGGLLVGPGGARAIEGSMPHGDGRLIQLVRDGGTLDKKGEITPSRTEMRRREDRDLEIYACVREFFENRLGRSLFLLYGTLLGYYRDGDLIPGDDDFDVGYVSDKTDPVAVKEEAKNIIVDLVRAGFTVSFNRKGRLFRVQLQPTEAGGCHIDVHPIWFQDGNVWIHNLAAMPSTRDDYLPPIDGTLRGVGVCAPRDTERFLRGNYGPGWKVPDPGFHYYPSAVDPAIRRNLGKALISVAEYKALAEEIQRDLDDSTSPGRLVSLGSQDLYPLDKFII